MSATVRAARMFFAAHERSAMEASLQEIAGISARTIAGSSIAAVEGMSILLFLLFGVAVGLIARVIMPGKQSMGIAMTGLVGVAGSCVGGFVGSLLSGRPVLEFNTAGVVGSVLGALAVLAIMGATRQRSLG